MPEITARTAPLGLAFAPLRQAALAQAREHDLSVPQDDADGLSLDTYYGRIRFLPGAEGLEVEIRAPHAEYLQVLKDTIVAQIAAADPKRAEAIRWRDAPTEGRLPANAVIMSVLSVAPLAGGFLRVTLRARRAKGRQSTAITSAMAQVALSHPARSTRMRKTPPPMAEPR